MRYIILLFLSATFFSCNIGDEYGANKITNSLIKGNEIIAIPAKAVPVKNDILEKIEEDKIVMGQPISSESQKVTSLKPQAEEKVEPKNINTYSPAPFVEQKETVAKPVHQKKIINSGPKPVYQKMKVLSPKYDPIFAANPYYIAEGFDFPVGKPNGDGYFLALRFGQKLHLGEDWNGVGGGNTDLGDPIFAVADGYISFAEHICCGWGNTVRIIHKLDRHAYYEYVETVSSHLSNITVSKGTFVRRGDLIGHMGTADGKYSAHLHLEMRTFLDMNIGPGYSEDQFGYISPTPFIRQNR